MELTYKKATIEDIDLLTETRIKVLRAANQLSDKEDMKEVEKNPIIIIKKHCSTVLILHIWFLTENVLWELVVSVFFK